ncbi:hypothetical protein JCM11641_000117 [Rhodosporidiobolus odoratus]
MGIEIDKNHLIACNSTMAALVESALGLENQQLSEGQVFSAAYCQFAANSTVAAEAKHVYIVASSYGYVPSSGFALFAIVAFSISLIWHIYQLIRSKRWAYIAVLCGGALQIFGWVERYLAADDVQVGYVEQLATLTIAPTFFSAAIYSLFSFLAASQGPTLLPYMSPRKYMWSFISIDFVTLVIQAAGGAIAAITDDMDTFNLGCHIMLAGIILQLVTTFVFLLAFGVYYHHLRKLQTDALSLRTGSGRIFWGILLMAVLIIIRGLYRTAELAEGLFGPIATKQAALICCDAIPMILVIFLLNLTHPLYTIKAPTQAVVPSTTSSSEKMVNLHDDNGRVGVDGGRGEDGDNGLSAYPPSASRWNRPGHEQV